MRLHCIAGRHDAAPGGISNQGFAFSRCRCCGCDMVRSHRSWRRVPRGFRVVWRRRPPRPDAAGAAQLLLDLPPTGRALILLTPARDRLPDLLRRLLAWLRALRRSAAR